MPEIKPFRGIRYNPDKRGNDLSRVTTPPYDCISEEAQEKYYQASSYNIIRVILGKDYPGDNERHNKYTRAADTLKEWMAVGILIRDEEPAIYLYEQEYTLNGAKKTRWGLICLVKLEKADFHERTFEGPKADRLKLMQATGANTSQVFALYQDPDNSITKAIRDSQSTHRLYDLVTEDEIRHRLWAITDQAVIKTVSRIMKDQRLTIADGHHRYETALNFRQLQQNKAVSWSGQEGCNYRMIYLSNAYDEGMAILPTHRIIPGAGNLDQAGLKKRISQFFEIKSLGQREEMFRQMGSGMKRGLHLFGLNLGNNEYLSLTLRESMESLEGIIPKDKSKVFRELDVTILHYLLIDHILWPFIDPDLIEEGGFKIEYSADPVEASQWARETKGLVFFLNPIRVEEVMEVARQGERMPQKSTYFYPKLLTGLVMNLIE
ncbi:MAG: DUF1015 domain-containing protein [bacterium]